MMQANTTATAAATSLETAKRELCAHALKWRLLVSISERDEWNATHDALQHTLDCLTREHNKQRHETEEFCVVQVLGYPEGYTLDLVHFEQQYLRALTQVNEFYESCCVKHQRSAKSS